MPGEQHLFNVTRWLLQAGTAFCIFLLVVLGLALAGTLVIATDIGARIGVPARARPSTTTRKMQKAVPA